MRRTLATTIPFGYPFDPVRCMRAYAKAGVTSLQFYRNPDQADCVTVVEALAAAAEAGLRYDAIHGLFGPDLDPSSPDVEMQRHCLTVYEQEGKLSLDLGGPIVVVHPSCELPGRRETDPNENTQRQMHLRDFLHQLADVGERLGVTYLIENLAGYFYAGSDCKVLASLVIAVESPRLRMCFDTGHAHMTGDVCASLRSCAPAIGYVHVNDNDGKEDSHLMPGDGSIDWTTFAQSVRDVDLRCPMMLEVFDFNEELEHQLQGSLKGTLAEYLVIDDTD